MSTLATNALLAAQAIRADLLEYNKPPDEGLPPTTEYVLAHSIVRGTRGYIEKVVRQINGAYENGCYDACAVLIRRLAETLIIEAFEKNGIDSKIKDPSGNFLSLNDLITATLAESSWNLSRNVKTGLPKLKSIGDFSAHSRRYNAHRSDIDVIISDLRILTQELLFIAGLK